ncbi:MAG: hypothetical protein JSS69_08250 [Acidobacteria bacterium]|nr:hypothetical protein [Acidobacteriota bacterium]MBS1865895.1 hypothetical protein [Acidobacteriota bacterium]
MNRSLWKLGFVAGLLASIASASNAATVQGKVVNATTGKPAASVEVILIQLQGTMQPVANTKSNAQGEFTFDHPGIGAQPMLVRAVYHGVNFHQPLPPGKNSVEVNVYDLSSDVKSITVPSHLVIFQPNGSTLTIAEQFLVRNETKPPMAYFRADGNFQMTLTDNATVRQIAASGPSGMPVVQAPIELGKNKYAIAYAFRPGDNEVRLAYEVPYSGNAATVKISPSYGESRVILVVPPSMTVTADQLQSAGQEQGMNLYEHSFTGAPTAFAVNLSGTAPPPNDAASENDSQAGGAQQGTPIQVVPGRLDGLKWPLLGVLVVAFALGGFLLSRKTVEVNATNGTAKLQSTAQSPAQAPASLAALDKETATSLDGLKDLIFKLELRRQAGTISESEYAAERAKAEQILRDLVRG